MSYSVDSLEPKLVWKYFDKIREIPHGSKNETALSKAIAEWAKEKGCEVKTDDLGNVIIKIKATAGYENSPIATIQGHIDMVCEKNSDKEFDFEKDSIVLVREGDWITADGTTLGADNGIGVAMGLALMELPDAVHGPIEVLCTIDEETGLNGAVGLKPDFVDGRMLLNLDSEEVGVFYVGCCGGRDTHFELPITTVAPSEDQSTYQLVVKGLRGGHSGLDIAQNRGNAIRMIVRALLGASREAEITLASISGGDKHNAIPREAEAVFQISAADKDKVSAIFDRYLEGFKTEFASAEPELTMVMSETTTPEKVLSGDSGMEALSMCMAIPHGLVAMSRDLEGLVESSTNMARVRIEGETLTVLTSSRSSVQSAVDGIVDQLIAVGELAGAKVEASEGYPGWQPNMESALLASGKKAWAKKFGEEPKFTAIHAGLECGIIGEKYPGMDMISFGPSIENPHSPDERVSIPTVEKTFDFLLSFLETIAKG